MTVLLVTNDFPPMGGGVANCYGSICATVPPHRVIVLAPRFPGDQEFDRTRPYRVIRRAVPLSPRPLSRLTQILLLFVHALGIVRRERISAVLIGHLHLGLIGLALRRWLRVPYAIYLHGGEMAAYMRFRPARAVAACIIQNACVVVANSEFARNHYASLGIRPRRVEILMPSTGVERFRPDLDCHRVRTKYGLDGHKVLLTVARLVERKGHDVVIRALGKVRESVGSVRYLVVGEGPEEPKLRALARDLGCEDMVRFLGYVSADEVPYLYASCDVFVMPSRALSQRDGIEGLGIVFVEAGASAKPVVGGRSGGIPEVVLDGVTGILVDPMDVDGLVRVLTRLLLNPVEAVRLGRGGRRRAEEIEAAWTTTLRSMWDELTLAR